MALQTTGTVVIDPAVSFGRPIIGRLGVPTSLIADRYKAGERVDDLAADYGAERDEIEEAIRCELPIKAAYYYSVKYDMIPSERRESHGDGPVDGSKDEVAGFR